MLLYISHEEDGEWYMCYERSFELCCLCFKKVLLLACVKRKILSVVCVLKEGCFFACIVRKVFNFSCIVREELSDV